MKQLLSIILIFTNLSCLAQVTVNVKWQQHNTAANSDTIYYNTEKKLVWPDFKGKPVLNGEAVAITNSGFGYLAAIKYLNQKMDITITVYCYFSKKKFLGNTWQAIRLCFKPRAASL